MNYYIQGSPARAEEIKAAFEAKGFIPRIAPMYYGSESVLFFTGTDNYIYETSSPWVMDIIKTHPDYKELELPVEFKDGDIIGFNDCTHNDGSYIDWVGIYKQGIETNQHLFHCVIPSCRSFRVGGMWRVFTAYPATKEQRDLLFAKMREAGYQWDADKKELRKIQPHYDISNFQPFDKVLIRLDNNSKWTCDFFSYYHKGFHCIGCDDWSQCIPFDGNEHLLGTTNMCDEQYINW